MRKPKESAIYKITCLANGKIYVGSASDYRKRWSNHKSSLRKGKHNNQIMQRTWDKYGEASFVFSVIEKVSVSMLVEREQYWMDALNVCDKKIGLNIYTVAYSSHGRVITEETREKMRKAAQGKKLTKEHKEAIARALEGSKSHLAKLDEKKVKDIKERLIRGERGADIAKRYKVTPECISSIARGNTWKHVKVKGEPETSTLGERHWNSKLKAEDVVDIKKRLSLDESCRDIAEDYGVKRQTISDIKAKRTWKKV